jgi:hypothetical protein
MLKRIFLGFAVLGAFSAHGFAAKNGIGYQCIAVASNGVGHGGQTYWGEVKPTVEEARTSAEDGCNLSTSHGPCEPGQCWYSDH